MKSAPPELRGDSVFRERGGERLVVRPVLVDQFQGGGAGALEQRAVGAQLREAQVAEARLAGAEQLALAAQLEVALGELEAVGRVDERLEPARARPRSARSFGREISRQYDCSAPRPTRPRSWWSCARPKRSASWTIMIVAFGTSTPTSITVVATSTSSSPCLEARHQLAPVGRLQPPVQAADAVRRELRPLQPRRLGLGRAREPGGLGLPRSAGTRRTPAGPRRGARAAARTPRRAPLLATHAVTIGFRVRRRLRDLGHGEVAVDGERERPRDRRRRHVQHVRRAPLGQRRPLLDAEAVLLVDDRDREVGELDARAGSAHACRRRSAPRRPRSAARASPHRRAGEQHRT